MAMVMVDNIAAAFCQADPANEEIYLANADAYKQQLTQLDAAFMEAVAQGQRTTIVLAGGLPCIILPSGTGLPASPPMIPAPRRPSLPPKRWPGSPTPSWSRASR